MAITTENTYFIHSTDGKAYSKLIDIKEFPDLGSAPGTVDVTTLSDHMKKYLAGLVDTGQLEFKANYDKTDFTTVNALVGKTGYFGIQFGKSGEDGTFTFQGQPNVIVNGAGTESAVDMTVTVTVSSEIELSDVTVAIA